MTGLVLADVAIAIIFTILVVSIIASAIVETIASLWHWRAAGLQRGLRSLMGGGVDDFMDQVLVKALSVGEASGDRRLARKPSAMAPAIFAKQALAWLGVTLDDLAHRPIVGQLEKIKSDNAGTGDLVREGKAALAEKLAIVLRGVEAEVAEIETAVATWFDDSIQRVGGWYRRRTRTLLFWIGLLLATALNINLVQYADYLTENDQARAAVVQEAMAAARVETLDELSTQLIEARDLGPDSEALASIKTELKAMRAQIEKSAARTQAPMGWQEIEVGQDDGIGTIVWNWLAAQGGGSPLFWLTGIFSWIAMGFAVTLGAQFWFDLLKRFVKVRTAGLASGGEGKEGQTT